MGKSFPFRRLEINAGSKGTQGLMLVSNILKRWPALKIKNYVSSMYNSTI